MCSCSYAAISTYYRESPCTDKCKRLNVYLRPFALTITISCLEFYYEPSFHNYALNEEKTSWVIQNASEMVSGWPPAMQTWGLI